MKNRTVMLVAGEVSGDIHAANLARTLAAIEPGIELFGVCGDRMTGAGVVALASTSELAHMGLIEVVRELPRIRRLMQRLVATADVRRPDLAVLVDSPDFNLRLARRLGKRGIPVVLYVSPQLWAWRKGRVRQVRRRAREVLCILPFEVDFYRQHGVAARYVGHPLVDDIEREGLRGGVEERFPKRLALLPGSRAMEVGALLPSMLETLSLIGRDLIDDVVLIEADGVGGAIDQVLAGGTADSRLRRVTGESRRKILAESALALTASGTATLECALLDVPMIVGYRLGRVSWALARMLVDVPHVALVNLILGERAVPELLQGNWDAPLLAAEVRRILGERGEGQYGALRRARERLGPPGASNAAAEAVLEHLNRSR